LRARRYARKTIRRGVNKPFAPLTKSMKETDEKEVKERTKKFMRYPNILRNATREEDTERRKSPKK